MRIRFEKYQGTGNDFIMLDNLNGQYNSLSIDQIKVLCDRHFGIGADGLIKINRHKNFDFEMDYYNSDGSKSFCGNGTRCAVTFAKTLGIEAENIHLIAIDGEHSAQIIGDAIALDMLPLAVVNQINNDFILDTGSPHFVRFVDDLKNESILQTGREIRYSNDFKIDGINVNLVEQISKNVIRIETYERGVEDETLSCGTGATACALVVGLKNAQIGKNSVIVQVKGGELSVEFEYHESGLFDNIKLIGPAKFVFKGEIDV